MRYFESQDQDEFDENDYFYKEYILKENFYPYDEEKKEPYEEETNGMQITEDESKKNSEKPIDMTPESILKQHKTYQEEMMESENNDKINPEIESTMEKMFFSDEKKDNEKSSPQKNKKESNSVSNKSLIEEMTEIVPESKT